MPLELLNECINRSRDRYQREYSKLHAFFINSKFYTEEGLKDRAHTLKYKMLAKERYPEVKNEKDLNPWQRALTMMVLHNTSVRKI